MNRSWDWGFPYCFCPPNLSSIWSAICRLMQRNCGTNQRPWNGGYSVGCFPKLIRPARFHQIWVQFRSMVRLQMHKNLFEHSEARNTTRNSMEKTQVKQYGLHYNLTMQVDKDTLTQIGVIKTLFACRIALPFSTRLYSLAYYHITGYGLRASKQFGDRLLSVMVCSDTIC